MNQWKNTDDVIDQFKSIEDKQHCKFVIFDIKDFYTSIKESLLKQSLDFAEKYTKVISEDKVIIKHARKSLLFNKQQIWIKKESGLFDVMMGAYDGAEVVNLLEFLYFISSHAYTTRTTQVYTEMTVQQYLGIQMVHKQKKLRNISRAYSVKII